MNKPFIDIAKQNGFLPACRGETPARLPVWFMRQAGRALPEYRAIRGTNSILEVVKHPEVVAEITLQPVARYGVDAAILYSDIMVPAAAIGFGVDIKPGIGPVVENPFTNGNDLGRLRELEAESDISYVLKAIELIKGESPVPLIGFAGAPFTVASYLIEGGPSRTYHRTKRLMLEEPLLWHALMERLSNLAADFLEAQIKAGVNAVQLFDSWAGALTPSHYEKYVQPHSRHIFDRLSDYEVAKIHFGVATGELLGLMSDMEVDVLGVDWRVPLSVANRRCAKKIALQGNLDPAVCLGSFESVANAAKEVLTHSKDAKGYIFNLGHGVLPETDPAILAELVDLIHEQGQSIRESRASDC